MPPTGVQPVFTGGKRSTPAATLTRRVAGADGLSSPPVEAAAERAGRARPPPSNLMRIHGIWYDTTGFDHPGGPIALSLGGGRDATILFRSSHILSNSALVDATLRRLEVPAARQAQLEAQYAALVAAEGGAAAFELAGGSTGSTAHAALDPFEADVMSIARRYFQREAARRGVPLRAALKATPRRWLELAALTAAFVASACALVAGWWPALVLAPTAAWVWMVAFWHDAAHFAMSADWRVNAALTWVAPWFSSPLMWYHQHVIGHHCYTNVERRDPDLYHAPALWRFQHGLRWRPAHAWQSLTTPLLWSLSVWTLLVLKPLATLYTGVLNRAVVLLPLPRWRVAVHLAGRALVLASLHAWPWFAFRGDPLKAAVFAVVPIGVFSLWFMACSQVNHHAGELSHSADRRWYRHQVMTSHTIAPDSAAAFWLSGGLNLQIEHHLFPTVNHCHLRALQALIEDAARRHGVPYCRSDSIPEAFAKLWRHLGALSVNPRAAK